ncbi:MAG: addiction module antidote protein [Candidatus Latescibacterota bacterium]
MRLNFGSGYRIYFGQDGDVLVILLCGGDKSTQQKDIEKARVFKAKMMNTVSRSYRAELLKALTDPGEAAEYLNAALDDGEQEVFLLALRHVAEAHGISHIAEDAHLNRESMYRMLSKSGNPQLSSLSAILKTMGLELSISVKDAETA